MSAYFPHSHILLGSAIIFARTSRVSAANVASIMVVYIGLD
jgi:hypothetical protein